MTAPKGHMGTAGIIPVFLDGTDVWTLHRYANHLGIPTQDAAAILLTTALDQWNDDHPEPA